jgi:transcriptional regulator with XRE-family HTH domain
MQYDLQKKFYPAAMGTYGERLAEAMAHRGAQLGREITRIELSRAAGCSRQNIGMILTNAQGEDQKLSTERHAKAAAFLRVDPDWLLDGTGAMEPTNQAPKTLSDMAEGLAVLFDMIPKSDLLRRSRAYATAWEAIRRELPPEAAKDLG